MISPDAAGTVLLLSFRSRNFRSARPSLPLLIHSFYFIEQSRGQVLGGLQGFRETRCSTGSPIVAYSSHA